MLQLSRPGEGLKSYLLSLVLILILMPVASSGMTGMTDMTGSGRMLASGFMLALIARLPGLVAHKSSNVSRLTENRMRPSCFMLVTWLNSMVETKALTAEHMLTKKCLFRLTCHKSALIK